MAQSDNTVLNWCQLQVLLQVRRQNLQSRFWNKNNFKTCSCSTSRLQFQNTISFFIFSFWLFPSGVITANHLLPSNTILCTLFSHTDKLHVLFHYIQVSPLRSSSRPPACQFWPQHIFSIPPLYISKPSQSDLSDFISTRCPSHALIPDPIHPCRSQREP